MADSPASIPSQDLQSFCRFLEERGELIRVPEPVDPYLEVTEIADPPWSGQLAFEGFDMELVEVDINWNTYESTPVPDGLVLCVNEWYVETGVENWSW